MDLVKFKEYIGYSIKASNGTSSQGIATVRRVDTQSQNIITIPANTIFSVFTGQSFQNPDNLEINESQTFVPIFLQSTVIGANQNIPSGSVWNTPIAGISLENTADFVGGSDNRPEDVNVSSVLSQIQKAPDSVLQLVLDQSQPICMNIIGNPSSVPTTKTFEGGVFFLARYFLENRTKEKITLSSDMTEGVFKEDSVNYGIQNKKVHEGIMRILTGMLTPDRIVTAFMPEVVSG